jgi:hypothetical protein
MSMSDDPRGFRRGQGGGRDQAPRPGRSGPSADDRYDGYRQPESRPQRPQADKPAPGFSAFKPEAFAKPDAPMAPPERSDWDTPRGPAPAPRGPAPDPYSRPMPTQRDPYYSDAASDPYAPRSQQRGYEQDQAGDWGRDPYQDTGSNQFPNFYPPMDDAPPQADAPAMHDRFFGADPEPELPQQQQSGGRFRNSFDDHDYDRAPPAYDDKPAQSFSGQQSFGGERESRRDAGNYNGGFDDGQNYDWDNKYDQAPPPPSLRPSQPPAMPEEDLDADFFADEDEFDGDDYYEERRGGRKKLIAAVLTGAVVVGGGLAYVYKSTSGPGGGAEIAAEEPPAIVADSRPLKEEPADPGGRKFANGSKSIYERLGEEGGGGAAPSAESGGTLGVVTTGTLEERIENALKTQGGGGGQAPAQQASLDSPRVVTTTTFSPDGSQVAQPRAKRVPADAQNQDLSAGVVISAPPAQQEEPPAVEERPGTQQSSGGRQQVAAVQPQSRPAASEASGGSGYFVQIGARQDEDAANKAVGPIKQKYGSIIGSYNLEIRKADLGAKGVWYRMMFGPIASKEEGAQLCQQLEGAGLKGCLTRKE